MKTVRFFIAFLLPLFLTSCSGVYNSDKLKAGHIFEPQDYFEDETVSDYQIIDTLEEFERYIIARVYESDETRVPIGHADAKFSFGGGTKIRDYGIANFDNQFIIYPDFMYLGHLKDGYLLGALPGGFKNPDKGILHIRGEMITDFKYKRIDLKENTDSVKCSYRVDGDWFVDWVIL